MAWFFEGERGFFGSAGDLKPDMKSTPEFQKKSIGIQNLEVMNAEAEDSLKNNRNQNLINEVLHEEGSESQNLQAEPRHSLLVPESPANSKGRSLFWKSKNFKKPPKKPQNSNFNKHKHHLKNAKGAAARIRQKAQSARAKLEPEPKRIPGKKRTFKPIKPFKMGTWRPRTTLKPPKMSLKRYSPDYCACKKRQKFRKRSTGKALLTEENCTCGETQPKNATFEDNGPFPDDYFDSKQGEQWYTAQATVFRQYVRAKEREQKKYLKQAKTEFLLQYQTKQIEAVTKHYADMYNINRQLKTKKERIFRKIMGIFKLLTKKAGMETVGSVMSACKLSISKAMVRYSKKYPKFLRQIKKEIDNWKAFMLEKHHIYFEEHEEKVQAYYDALEREKNENLAMEDAKKEAENQKGQQGAAQGEAAQSPAGNS